MQSNSIIPRLRPTRQTPINGIFPSYAAMLLCCYPLTVRLSSGPCILLFYVLCCAHSSPYHAAWHRHPPFWVGVVERTGGPGQGPVLTQIRPMCSNLLKGTFVLIKFGDIGGHRGQRRPKIY